MISAINIRPRSITPDRIDIEALRDELQAEPEGKPSDYIAGVVLGPLTWIFNRRSQVVGR